MSAPIRLLDTGPLSPRRNIAVGAALAELHLAGQSPDMLRLCTYPRSVLVGRHQRIAEVVRVRACRGRQITVARRATDGGAVYLSPGMLGWELIVEPHRFGNLPGEIAERIHGGIAAALARFGLPARFRPLNDVAVGGRMVAGSFGLLHGPTLVVQGMILVDVDIAEMAAVLRAPGIPKQGAGAVLARRITTLSEWLGRVPSLDEVRQLLIAGLAHAWGREFTLDALLPAELKLAGRLLRDRVGAESFADMPRDTDAVASMAAATAAAAGARAS